MPWFPWAYDSVEGGNRGATVTGRANKVTESNELRKVFYPPFFWLLSNICSLFFTRHKVPKDKKKIHSKFTGKQKFTSRIDITRLSNVDIFLLNLTNLVGSLEALALNYFQKQ